MPVRHVYAGSVERLSAPITPYGPQGCPQPVGSRSGLARGRDTTPGASDQRRTLTRLGPPPQADRRNRLVFGRGLSACRRRHSDVGGRDWSARRRRRRAGGHPAPGGPARLTPARLTTGRRDRTFGLACDPAVAVACPCGSLRGRPTAYRRTSGPSLAPSVRPGPGNPQPGDPVVTPKTWSCCREQADLPAEQPPSREDARFPPAHAHPRRPRHPRRSSPQGPRRALGLRPGRCCPPRTGCGGPRTSAPPSGLARAPVDPRWSST